jgi:hypothetical protein
MKERLPDPEGEGRHQDGQQGASLYAAPVGVVMPPGISIVGLRGIQGHNSIPLTHALGSIDDPGDEMASFLSRSNDECSRVP